MADTTKFPIKNFIRLTIGLFIIVLMITISFFKNGEAMRMVQQSLEIQHQIKEVLITLVDAETGQRGYLVTKEEKYLEPYIGAKYEYGKQYKKLKSMLVNFPNELKSLNTIDSLAALKFDELSTSVSLIKNKSAYEAFKLIKTDTGKALMDEIRLHLQSIIQHQKKLKHERGLVYRNWKYSIIALLALSFFLIIFSITSIYREIQPIFKELTATKQSLQNASINLSESLDKLKKEHQKIEVDLELKNDVIKNFNLLIGKQTSRKDEI